MEHAAEGDGGTGMIDREKVIKGLEHCSRESEHIDDNPCEGCPYLEKESCIGNIHKDALALLKEQEEIIKQYHKADTFLDVHGWKWEGR